MGLLKITVMPTNCRKQNQSKTDPQWSDIHGHVTIKTRKGSRSGTADEPEEGQMAPEDFKLRKLWLEFCQHTALHGANKLSGTGCTVRSIFWSIALLASSIYLVYTVVRELNTYYSYPTVTDSKFDIVDEMEFPAITLCNMSPRSRQKISKNPKVENFWKSISAFSAKAKPINWSEPEYQELGFFDPRTKESLLNESVELEDFVQFAMFDLKGIKIKQEFKYQITVFGLCFTWNWDGMAKTRRKGLMNNFQVILNITASDNTWSFDVAGGVKVIIHAPGESPDLMSEGLVVAPGTVAYIKLDQQKYTYLPYPFKALKNGYCMDTDSPHFVNPLPSAKYSAAECERKCCADAIRQACGCIDISDIGVGPYCSLYKFYTCYFTNFGRFLINHSRIRDCGCKMPCQFTTYAKDLSFGQYPSRFVAEELTKSDKFTNSTELLRDDLIHLNIFYEKLLRMSVQQLPQYSSVEQVFANLGGQMGLFLGASILTLSELVEFLFFVVYHVIWNVIKRRRENIPVDKN